MCDSKERMANDKKRLPVGLDSFKKKVDEDYYLIDKTLMIKIGIKILSGLLFYAT